MFTKINNNHFKPPKRAQSLTVLFSKQPDFFFLHASLRTMLFL